MAMLNNQMVYINIFQGKNPIKPFIFFWHVQSAWQAGSLASQQVAELHVPGPSLWMGVWYEDQLTIWLWHSQFAMENHNAIKNGKPSISIRAIYTMAMLVITGG